MLDVAVLGAGVAGASAAWVLAGRGRSVVVLEQFGLGHWRGSSHGAERIVRLGYTAPEYVRLVREALEGWRRLEAECDRSLLHVCGVVDHGDPSELGLVADAYEACGVGHEWLPAAAARERWPGLRFEGPVLHQPDGGWVEAGAAVAALLERAAALGAEVRAETPVLGLRPGPGGVAVRLPDGEVRARVAVVAAGAWSAPLLRGLVELPPITVTQEQVAYLRPLDGAMPWPCFLHRDRPSRYGLPTPDGLLKVGEHGTGPVVDPDARTFEVEPHTWARLLDHVRAWVPGVDPVPVSHLTCLYAATPSDDLVLDRVGPLVVAAGLGGHGFKFGPALGRVLADLVDGAGGGPFALGADVTPAGPSGAR